MDREFNCFIVAQIEGKPKKTYACTIVQANDNKLFELPEDAIIIKMMSSFGSKPIIYYLTEVDPIMPGRQKDEPSA